LSECQRPRRNLADRVALSQCLMNRVSTDFAPLVGKTGVKFEREALLLFYNTLDEQRHLTGVMVGVETDPTLKKFLETTKAQLEARCAKVGDLLNRRYFTQ
jgi:hypothetical protein